MSISNPKLTSTSKPPSSKLCKNALSKVRCLVPPADCPIAFKSHKKFIEKEVSLVVNKINQLKKTGSTKGCPHVIEVID